MIHISFTLSQVGCVKLEMTSYMKYYEYKTLIQMENKFGIVIRMNGMKRLAIAATRMIYIWKREHIIFRLMDIGFMTGIKLLADMYAILPLQHQAYRLMEMIMISELQSRYHGIRHM